MLARSEPWPSVSARLKEARDFRLGLVAADPVGALDGLAGLELLVDLEEVLDLEAVELRQVVDVAQVLEPRVGDRHAQHLVVAAGLVGHPVHPDRPGLDQAARERRLADQQHQRVERVAVEAEGVLDEAVVGGVLRRGEQGPVEPDPAAVVVDLVLVAAPLGDLHQDVELHGSSTNVHQHQRRVRTRAATSSGPVSRTMATMRQSQSRWATRWGPVVLVLALLAGGFATYQWDLGERWFGSGTTPPEPDPETEPAAVPPPEGLTLPLPATPAPVAPGRRRGRRRPDVAAQGRAAAGAPPGGPRPRQARRGRGRRPLLRRGRSSSRAPTPGRPPRPSCSRRQRRWTSWAPTTASPRAWSSTAAASSAEWCSSAGATPTWPASRRRRTSRRTPSAPTCARSPDRPPRRCRSGDAPGSVSPTTTRSSPDRTSARTGSAAT